MRKKDFRHLHGNLTAIAEYVESELGVAVEYDAYENVELDTYMNFQSLKHQEREAVEALLSDIIRSLNEAQMEDVNGQNVEAWEAPNMEQE